MTFADRLAQHHDPSLKRVMDVLVSSAVLSITSPILLAVALAIARTMGRPVFFIQERAGMDGRPFRLIKFRTMRQPEPGQDQLGSDNERLTQLGRILRTTSLDELPTFLNVIKGDMSLVGPRPLPVAYLDRYSPVQIRRHDVRPGVTGWAQVNGRNSLSWTRKFELDVWYVEHRSTSLDLRILIRTVAQVLKRSGISHGDHSTMPEFRGETEVLPDS